MNQLDITKSKIYPVIVLESYISEKNIRRLIRVLEYVFLFFVIVAMSSSLIIKRLEISNSHELASQVEIKSLGFLSLILLILLICLLIRSYLRSSYYFDNVINNRYNPKDLYTFTVGRILYQTKNGDWLRGFLLSEVGKEIVWRCGVSLEKINEFLSTHQTQSGVLNLSTERLLKLRDLAQWLYRENADFSRLLYVVGVGEEDFLNVVDWVVKGIESDELQSRWWRKENLNRLGSIGKNWSYGITPHLDLYSRDLLDQRGAEPSVYDVSFRLKEVKQLENILARSKESNVLLVGETEPVRMDVLWEFVRLIKTGSILPNLEHKRVLFFNTALFLSGFKERVDFENELIKVFNEAVKAGDIILVFSDFANFLIGADSLHSQVFSLLDPYFSSSRLQIVAMSDTDKFHQVLESKAEVTARFERVLIHDLSNEETVMTLLESVDLIEKQSGLHFSYPALTQIVQSADLYLQSGSLTEKAKDLINEIVPWALRNSVRLVGSEEVLSYLSEKTNIPLGQITEGERGILSNLEKILHERVIGQDLAISAVSSAMKRARAGVQNTKRPLGSFLFLGPTGVGKTETAKALAAAYFGNEDKLMRLDMTEYQDDDSLNKLIGSFEGGKTGVLSNLIRQNSFGVLLLDEFEKSNKEVQNLFLQILDEGIFSDMNGKRVNARNIIFISTSNAGSDSIWQMVRSGNDPVKQKDTIINEIVTSGVFKPELLNRYDEVVVFHPLTSENLRLIAGLMLKKLKKRLEEKGINLIITDFLIDKVSHEGANEVFGARPMNRYIQDKIEQIVADKIISGELKPGGSIEFKDLVSSPGQTNENFTIEIK